MDTGELILVGLVVGGGAYLLLRGGSSAAAPAVTPPPPSTRPGDLYTGNDLGPFKGVLALPGVGQAYGILAPVNTKVIQPIVGVAQKTIVMPANQALGLSKPTTTVNTDGTINRQAPDNWYTRNVGKPISHAGSAVVHWIGSVL